MKLLPGGWRECKDDVTGDSYYYNERGEVTWDKPEEFAALVEAGGGKGPVVGTDWGDKSEAEDEDDLREGVIAFRSPESNSKKQQTARPMSPPNPPPMTPEQEKRLAEEREGFGDVMGLEDSGVEEEMMVVEAGEYEEDDGGEGEGEEEEDVPMSYLEGSAAGGP